jgi:nitrite reductase/ring-hydroxylating ferredoxin subunit
MTDHHHGLCRLEDIPENSGRGFTVDGGEGRPSVDLLAVRRGAEVFVYRNRCPHKGLNLDWVPGNFMDPEGTYIHCANHDALFEVANGRCIAGPCRGAQLTAVQATITADGRVAIRIPE